MKKTTHAHLSLRDLPLSPSQIALVILLSVCLWLGLLSDYLHYDGFSRNDTAAHRIYVDAVIKMLQGSGLNLDHWFNTAGVGSPLFRVYQHLPHLVAGWLAVKLGWNASHAVHFLIVVSWLLQFPAWYLASRWMGLSKFESLLVVWCAPLIQAWVGLGHELRSYLFYGFGLFTQAVAFPFFILFWGASIRLLGFGAELKKPPTSRHFFFMGGALGFIFLVHHYYGYMAILFLAFGLAFALFTNRISFEKRVAKHLSLFFLAFFLVTAYQVLSIIEDLPLQHEVLFYLDPERTLGFGWSKVFHLVLSGSFLDSYRLPVLSLLALGGLLFLVKKDRSRALMLSVPLLIAILFMAGKEGLGVITSYVPGFSFMNHERFVVVAQLTGVFLAAEGAYFLFDFIYRKSRTLKQRWIAVGFAVLPILYLYYDRVEYVRVNRMMLGTQRDADPTLPQSLLVQLREQGGKMWNPQTTQGSKDYKSLPHLGTIIYDSVLGEAGVPTFTRPTDTASYGSETTLFFEKERRTDYEVFNVKSVLLYHNSPAPFFFAKTMELGEYSLYRVPSRGDWDVIRIPTVSITRNEKTWYMLVSQWLKGSAPGVRSYASFVPLKASRIYPEGVPKVSSEFDLSAPLGDVTEQSSIEEGHAHAVLEATDDHQFGLLRTAYHPRWEIRRNGVEVTPVWAGPGYLAFPLMRGTNRVEVQFARDPLRNLLFNVSLAMLTLLGLVMLYKVLISFRLVQRFLHPAGSVV